MNSKKRLLLIVLMLLLLIGGASALYAKMSEGMGTQNLSTVPAASPQSQEVVETKKEAEIDPASEDSQQTEKVMAPNFKVTDIDGNEVELYDYLGKPTVVNFWASWCGYCKLEMPDFEEAYKKYGEEVNFLMVNLTDGYRETLEIASEYIAEQGYTFPVLYDTFQDAAYNYGVYSLPITFFIDAEGNGIAQASGAIDLATLELGIDMIREQSGES